MSNENDKVKKVLAAAAVIMGAAYTGLSIVAKKKKADSIYSNDAENQNLMEGKKVVFVEDDHDKENADGKKGHLEAIGPSEEKTRNKNFYEKHIKRGVDKALSFGGLVLLSPVMGAIALAIKVEDPGPVLFTQKRVGADKQYFKLHKFRSMKMSTPHDVPTHMLDNPDQYITKVGKFIRAHSLDELPQIWDIFIGNMSVIGPRPALWNQDVLVSERDKYGANDVKPGLTGWAQINGRDELEIPEKARLDGVYTKELEKNSIDALKMDVKCFAGSIGVFAKDDTVVEGGTGELAKESHRTDVPAEDPKEYFGCDYTFEIDKKAHKKVLVVGKGSYIGETFVKYAEENYKDNFNFKVVDTLPQEDGTSELDHLTEEELSQFDIVYHLAGIAHADVGHVDDATKEKYYKVNTDLAVQTAKRYKEALDRSNKRGLFVLMSSMIVYGDSAPYGKERIIDKNTKPSPANFYGDSKWQADKGVRNLADDTFKVAVIRPPMIYGKGSKGNYPTLAKLAKKLPIFPDVDNARSMLYVGNLCEFLSQLFISKAEDKTPDSLIFMPQNPSYTKTADMVNEIADASHHRIKTLKIFNPAVLLADHVPGKVSGLVDKAFGNNAYDQALSQYNGLEYKKYSLEQSIKHTEGETEEISIDESKSGLGKKVLIVASVASMIDQFNKSNIEVLQSLGYDVDVATNFKDPGTITLTRCKELIKWLNEKNVDSYQIDFDRNVADIKADKKAFQQLNQVFMGSADTICDIDVSTKSVVQSHPKHIEKNYAFMHCHSPIGGAIGRIVAYRNHVKSIYTAHGFHFYDEAPLKNWLIYYPIEKELSRITDILITINKEDYNRAKEKFYAKKVIYIPGIGIDVEKFKNASETIDKSAKRREIGVDSDDILLLSVGELNENKNHSSVIKAIGKLQKDEQLDYHLVYCIAGKGEKENELKRLAKDNGVDLRLLGFRNDIPELLAASDMYVLPSLREGLNVSLMEAMAAGKICLAGKIRGNVDLIDEFEGGYLFNPKEVSSLCDCLKNALNDRIDWQEKGKYNLKKIQGFTNKVVAEKYKYLVTTFK